VRTPPVKAVALWTFHVLVLRFENVRRYAVFDRFSGALLKGLVTFQTAAEWLELAIELERGDNLL
jgi:hypothetical protein